MKYFLRMENGKLIEATEAEPVTIKGFEDLLLFSYHAVEDVNGKLTDPPYYAVSEATTGQMLGRYAYKTRADAVKIAAEYLDGRGLKRAKRVIVQELNKYGLINA